MVGGVAMLHHAAKCVREVGEMMTTRVVVVILPITTQSHMNGGVHVSMKR